MYFDIGSNIGLWAKANIYKTNTIISIEASPKTYLQLVENCKDTRRIMCLNYTVCDNNGADVVFYDCDISPISSLNKDWLSHPNSRFEGYKNQITEITCKSITIDKLIQLYGKPELIKIDVEAAEYTVVKSLTQKVQHLCFEWASECKDISYQCLDHLLGIGFTKFYVQFEDHYTFRPEENQYAGIDEAKHILNNTEIKKHWGMVWCM